MTQEQKLILLLGSQITVHSLWTSRHHEEGNSTINDSELLSFAAIPELTLFY